MQRFSEEIVSLASFYFNLKVIKNINIVFNFNLSRTDQGEAKAVKNEGILVNVCSGGSFIDDGLRCLSRSFGPALLP